jgi:pectate lyase
MKRSPALFLFILLIFLTAGIAAAQEQGKEITGKVTGAAQDPKGFAGVTFNGPKRYVSMTNSVGEFTVKNVQKGQYTVTVSQGNKVQSFKVDIDGISNLDLRVKW